MMRRDDYKTVKHMDKKQMEEYLQRIYRRGYDAGVKALSEQMKGKAAVETKEGGTEK